MTMTTTATRGPVTTHQQPNDEGNTEAIVFELMDSGKTDPQIVQATRLPLKYVRSLRAEYDPEGYARTLAALAGASGAAAGTPGRVMQPRADRIQCACGAWQSEHHAGGSGHCARTFCRAFEEKGPDEVVEG